MEALEIILFYLPTIELAKGLLELNITPAFGFADHVNLCVDKTLRKGAARQLIDEVAVV